MLKRWRIRILLFLAVLGPGFITANIDNDSGGIYTYSDAGAHWGYLPLWTLLPITLALIVSQEMCSRMGAVTGKGLSDLIREEFSLRWTAFVMLTLLIANGGIVPKPYVVQKILASDGSTIRNTRPSNLGRAIKPETAQELNQMMVAVVQGGTGTAAAIPGIQVAGKTGTAETNIPNVYTAWFAAFAPADHPQIAIAVVLEKQLNGFGGVVSAPIAKQVLEALLAR